MDQNQAGGGTPGRGRFPGTRWSLILSVKEGGSRSEGALAELCEGYWPPIYAYARRRGYPAEKAEDLTQGFFAKLLEKNYVAQADRERGRFRTFLLTSFRHYVANEWDRSQAQKRGGGRGIVSLDIQTAEGRLRIEPADDVTPDTLFARHWALTLLDRVLERLAQEMKENGTADRFERLKPSLIGSEPDLPYSLLAAELGVTENNVKQIVYRMRGRFKSLLRDEVAQTVDGEEAVAGEIRFLLEALGR